MHYVCIYNINTQQDANCGKNYSTSFIVRLKHNFTAVITFRYKYKRCIHLMPLQRTRTGEVIELKFADFYNSIIIIVVIIIIIIIIIIISGVGLSPLGTAATSGLLYKPQMMDEGDCGAIGGMKMARGNRSTRRKPAPAPLCQPQIPHDQTRAPTRAAAVGSQRLIA
jgi:hypothetical protein